MIVITPTDIGGLDEGMKLEIAGKQYVVVKMDRGHITCRRTFWQWCKDSWKGIWNV